MILPILCFFPRFERDWAPKRAVRAQAASWSGRTAARAKDPPHLPPHRRRALSRAFARFCHAHDDVTKALTGLPHGAEPIDIFRVEQYVKFAIRGAILLEANARGHRRDDHT
jgi:hypothetical protein